MTKHPRLRRSRIAASLLLLAVLAPASSEAAQQAETDPKRAQALELYKQQKTLEALPLFEELAIANPSDGTVQEGLGVCLLHHAATLSDPEKRRAEVKRSREALSRAQELGNNSDIVRILTQAIPADGNIPAFSEKGDVDSAMREGEAAFARRDMDAAIVAYQRAFLLDPHLYQAPLYIGDSYFQKRDLENAESWYGVAVSVNGDLETAYRYWGDALLLEKKTDQAHAKFIEAVIASPYSQATWAGLNHWAVAAGRVLSQPRIESPNKRSDDQGKTTVTVDINVLTRTDGTSAWILYDGVRISWKQKLFQQKFPDAKEYRHSLAEESAALGAVASNARETLKKDPEHLDPALKLLVELSDKELLEAYILLARADEGIAQDYVSYRAEHRGNLRRYLNEYVGTQKK